MTAEAARAERGTQKIQFTLTPEDLERVQQQLLARRRDRLQASPWFFAFATIAAGIILWPVWRSLGERSPFLSRERVQVELYVAIVLIAAGIAWLVKMFVPAPKFTSLYAWSARRMNRKGAAQSVFGPVSVELTALALLRTNSVDTLEIPLSQIAEVLRTPDLATVRIRKQRRVVVLPRRAFESDEAMGHFLAAVQRDGRSRVIDVEL